MNVSSQTNNYWDEDHRCIHCGAGDDNHHSWTCPTEMHPDKQSLQDRLDAIDNNIKHAAANGDKLILD